LRNKRLAAAAALLAPAAIFLAACGGSDSNSTQSSSSNPAPAATTSRSGAGADVAPTTASASTPSAATTPSTSGSATASAKLNLNTSTGADYKRVIPNFPDRFVTEFLEYKPYVSIQQFRKEIGKYNVGHAQLTEWEKYDYVPVKPNDADAETLKQLPKVDDSVASKLVAARPYANNDAFLAKLSELAPGVDLNAAKAMLG